MGGSSLVQAGKCPSKEETEASDEEEDGWVKSSVTEYLRVAVSGILRGEGIKIENTVRSHPSASSSVVYS